MMVTFLTDNALDIPEVTTPPAAPDPGRRKLFVGDDGNWYAVASDGKVVRLSEPREPYEITFNVLDNLDGFNSIDNGQRRHLRFPVPPACTRGLFVIPPRSHNNEGQGFAHTGANGTSIASMGDYPAHLAFRARQRAATWEGADYLCHSMFVGIAPENAYAINVGTSVVRTHISTSNAQARPAPMREYSVGKRLLGFVDYMSQYVHPFVSGNAAAVIECAWIDTDAQELIVSLLATRTSAGSHSLGGSFFFQW